MGETGTRGKALCLSNINHRGFYTKSGTGQWWGISLQPQACCSSPFHTPYAQIRRVSGYVLQLSSCFPQSPVSGVWVCAWPQSTAALGCCFREEEDQAAALWATLHSQDCLEVFTCPSPLGHTALVDLPNRCLDPQGVKAIATLLRAVSMAPCWWKWFFENPFRCITSSQGNLLIDVRGVTQPSLGPEMNRGVQSEPSPPVPMSRSSARSTSELCGLGLFLALMLSKLKGLGSFSILLISIHQNNCKWVMFQVCKSLVLYAKKRLVFSGFQQCKAESEISWWEIYAFPLRQLILGVGFIAILFYVVNILPSFLVPPKELQCNLQNSPL